MISLLHKVNANGVGPAVSTRGQSGIISIWANSFGGGAVGLELSPDGGVTWIAIEQNGFEFLATKNTVFQLDRVGQGALLRAVLKNATNPVNVNAVYFD